LAGDDAEAFFGQSFEIGWVGWGKCGDFAFFGLFDDVEAG
jgi:hypothetical protein